MKKKLLTIAATVAATASAFAFAGTPQAKAYLPVDPGAGVGHYCWTTIGLVYVNGVLVGTTTILHCV
jgi:Spy/CpxP family protein refolding chaperone